MSAQKVASGLGLAALVALLVGVGLPAILPPQPVPEIVVPVDQDTGPTEPPQVVPSSRPDDDGDDDDGDDDDGDDDDDDTPDDEDDGDDDDGDDDSVDDTPDDSADTP